MFFYPDLMLKVAFKVALSVSEIMIPVLRVLCNCEFQNDSLINCYRLIKRLCGRYLVALSDEKAG